MLHEIRWTYDKLIRRLQTIQELVYYRRAPLAPFLYKKLAGPEVPAPTGPGVDTTGWTAVEPGAYWGEWGANFVLRNRFQVPYGWGADRPIALFLPIGDADEFVHPEALVHIDGQPIASVDRYHHEVILPRELSDGKPHELTLHGWIGRMGGDLDKQPLMRYPALVEVNSTTRQLVALTRVGLGTVHNLEKDDPVRVQLLSVMDDAFKALDLRDPINDSFYATATVALDILKAGIDQAGQPLRVDVTAVGHAHIDVAWLWTLGQTRQKARRTFYTTLRLMSQYPEYHFSQSQPQLYEFIREDDPDLWERIRQKIAEGRWEPMGGMWVEADCNLTGAESLARQFLLGRNFFREQFGPDVDSPILWLPDVFGYAWNLPQLIHEAGMQYFFTIKIGWSQYNRMPYNSFWWQGLDGSRVLTHFSPTPSEGSPFASTYNSIADPYEILHTWKNYQQKDYAPTGKTPPMLMAYGYGDGGGGPTREMIENIHILEDFPGMPRTHPGKAWSFFQDLERTAGDRLPVWNGELYLELHRGTYTSQGRNKRANRKSEFLLHDAEFLAALAAVLDPGFSYPHEQLTRAWKLVCLNQFHDILPGSSVADVYVESQQQYIQAQEIAVDARNAALEAIVRQKPADLVVANPTSFNRRDPALWLLGDAENLHLQRADGSPVRAQAVDGGVLLDVGQLPPYGVVSLIRGEASDEEQPESELKAAPDCLENERLRVEFNPDGDITRIYDKVHRREVIPAGEIANQFQAFEDRPLEWDAWDIDIYYEDKTWAPDPAQSVKVVENGPLRATLEITRRILNSIYVQRISLTRNSRRLDFDTTIQWNERFVLLKVAFPIDVLSPSATYEIQWGNVERPTHMNTSWDWARFETVGHKWVDLSEGGYGASLLNNSKYGHDIHGNVIRLSLLRGPVKPDPAADLGEHHFTYSLLPHPGGWDEHTIAQAYALNDPLIVFAGRGGQAESRPAMSEPPAPFVSVDAPNAVIETVKQAEDGQGVIVRLYESQRRRGPVTLTTSFPLASAWRQNILEENQEELAVEGSRVTFDLRPYQILTLRLMPSASTASAHA